MTTVSAAPARVTALVLALTVSAPVLTACSEDRPEQPPAPSSSTEPTSPRATKPSAAATPDAKALTAPALATDADDLARRLVAAEDIVRRADADEITRQQAAFETQVLYRQLARRPGWERSALAAAGRYRDTVSDHLVARRSLRSVVTRLSDQVPAWRITTPAPTAELLRYYRKGERVHGVPWEVLAAINLVETGFGRIVGYSSAGARGPMQFIASTWAAYGKGDIDDPHDAIMAAARYLAANGGARPARLDDALHAYNRHNGYVRGVRAYARILERDPDALAGLHRWQVTYLSTRGDLWLPEGYDRKRSIPAGRYLSRHPDRLLSPATG